MTSVLVFRNSRLSLVSESFVQVAGPINIRKSTNRICYTIFVIATVGFILLGCIIMMNGDSDELRYHSDSAGNLCGSKGFRDRKSLYIYEPALCAPLGPYISTYGCPSEKACLHKCTSDNETLAHITPYYNCLHKPGYSACYKNLSLTYSEDFICHRKGFNKTFEQKIVQEGPSGVTQVKLTDLNIERLHDYYTRYEHEIRWRYRIMLDFSNHVIILTLISIGLSFLLYLLVMLWFQYPKILSIVMILFASAVTIILFCLAIIESTKPRTYSDQEYLAFTCLHGLLTMKWNLYLIFVAGLIAFIVKLISSTLLSWRKLQKLLRLAKVMTKFYYGFGNILYLSLWCLAAQVALFSFFGMSMYYLSTYTEPVFKEFDYSLINTMASDAILDSRHAYIHSIDNTFRDCNPNSKNSCIFLKRILTTRAYFYGTILIMLTHMLHSFISIFQRFLISSLVVYWYNQPRMIVTFQDNIYVGLYGRLVRYHIGNMAFGIVLKPFYEILRLPFLILPLDAYGTFGKDFNFCAHIITILYGSGFLRAAHYAHSLHYRQKNVPDLETLIDSIFILTHLTGSMIVVVILYFFEPLDDLNDPIMIYIVALVLTFWVMGSFLNGPYAIMYTILTMLREEMERNSGRLVSKCGVSLNMQIFLGRRA